MSRFFRSSSDGSSSSEDEDDTQDVSHSSHLDVTKVNDHGHTHRDMLLHALLEERCLNDVVRENQGASNTRSRSDLEREGRLRYQQLCSQLASLDLVAPELDHDRHSRSRETYRDGLNLLSAQNIATPQAAIRRPLHSLLLTSSDAPNALVRDWHLPQNTDPLSILDPSRRFSLSTSQYHRDFEEIGMLGKGGYGMVFSVRHRLDNHVYAVKKVQISPTAMTQVNSTEHQPELEEMLAELRTLAKLEHPNVVRYYSSWVEWSSPSTGTPLGPDEVTGSCSVSHFAGQRYAPSTGSHSLQRIVTAGTETISLEDVGITFEEDSRYDSSSKDGSNTYSADSAHREGTFALEVRDDDLVANQSDQITGASIQSPARLLEYSSVNESIAKPEPMLALHIQMAMYPMTLADFLWPKPVANGTADLKPLAHCYHLEASIRIMLALLEGIDYVHSRGIVHRDLKPANIFLRLEKDHRSKQGYVDLMLCSACRANNSANPAVLSVCIGDFGLVSKIADQVSIAAAGSSNDKDHAVGTELYQPPRPLPRIGPQIDIFALGIIAFELLYKFSTQMERRETIQNLRHGRYPSHIPTQAEDIISAMLSDDPEKHTTVSELRRKLSGMLPL